MGIFNPKGVFGRATLFPHICLLLLLSFCLGVWIIFTPSIPLFDIILLHLFLSPI